MFILCRDTGVRSPNEHLKDNFESSYIFSFFVICSFTCLQPLWGSYRHDPHGRGIEIRSISAFLQNRLQRNYQSQASECKSCESHAWFELNLSMVAQRGIWMRIRGKNQNSLTTFVGLQCNFHRIAVDVHRSVSQIRFARSHVRYVRSFAGHVYTFTEHVRTQRSNVRNNNYFYVYPLYVAFCIRFGLTQFR